MTGEPDNSHINEDCMVALRHEPSKARQALGPARTRAAEEERGAAMSVVNAAQ
jgi:hypothetical protein